MPKRHLDIIWILKILNIAFHVFQKPNSSFHWLIWLFERGFVFLLFPFRWRPKPIFRRTVFTGSLSWEKSSTLEQGKSHSCNRPSNLTQIGLKWSIFRPCDLEIWRMTPKNKKALLLYYIKLCVSFQIHQWIQTGVIVRKRPIWVKFDDFFSRVTWKFDVWPWKTIEHLFYATSSFVHHFVAIGEIKLELQSGNGQFW